MNFRMALIAGCIVAFGFVGCGKKADEPAKTDSTNAMTPPADTTTHTKNDTLLLVPDSTVKHNDTAKSSMGTSSTSSSTSTSTSTSKDGAKKTTTTSTTTTTPGTNEPSTATGHKGSTNEPVGATTHKSTSTTDTAKPAGATKRR
jgi:hypothetical protein